MTKAIIGERLRLQREMHSLLQEDVARFIGVSKGCIHSWECGRTSPDAITLYKLAGLFGVSIAYFLKEEAGATSVDSTHTCELTTRELNILNKIRTFTAPRRHAFEVILGVCEK